MVSNLDMRRVTIALTLLLLILAPLIAQTDKGKPNEAQTHRAPNVPRTVDESVSVLKTSWLSAKDLDWLLRNPQKQAVAILYRPFGMGVRNQFGLWSDNQQLRDSCGENNPEGCSVVIFNRLWESVRSDADASLSTTRLSVPIGRGDPYQLQGVSQPNHRRVAESVAVSDR